MTSYAEYNKISKRYEFMKLAKKISNHLMKNDIIRMRSEEEIEEKSILEFILEVLEEY